MQMISITALAWNRITVKPARCKVISGFWGPSLQFKCSSGRQRRKLDSKITFALKILLGTQMWLLLRNSQNIYIDIIVNSLVWYVISCSYIALFRKELVLNL